MDRALNDRSWNQQVGTERLACLIQSVWILRKYDESVASLDLAQFDVRKRIAHKPVKPQVRRCHSAQRETDWLMRVIPEAGVFRRVCLSDVLVCPDHRKEDVLATQAMIWVHQPHTDKAHRCRRGAARQQAEADW